MGTRIQIRRDTSTNWSLNNPVLALGEPGLETDTQIIKYGDGVTTWNNLTYANLKNLSEFTTANLAEYSANLYFTNARVYANVDLMDFATNSQLALYATNSQLSSYATNNQLSLYATNAQLASYATNAQLSLYSTNAQISLKANISDLVTSNITEGSNLYYTNSRVHNYITDSNTVLNLNNTIVLASFTYDNLPAGVTGALVFESSNNIFRGYNGTHWVSLS